MRAEPGSFFRCNTPRLLELDRSAAYHQSMQCEVSVCVCVCVCVCACVYVCARACMRVCVCVSQWKDSVRRMAILTSDASDAWKPMYHACMLVCVFACWCIWECRFQFSGIAPLSMRYICAFVFLFCCSLIFFRVVFLSFMFRQTRCCATSLTLSRKSPEVMLWPRAG